MLNHCELLGRLAQDPEIRHTQNGTAVASFDLAVQVPSKDRNTPPDYIPIVCWRELATFAGSYLSKGRQVVVEGRISVRRYVASDGSKRKVVEVTASRIYFADSNSGNAQNSGQTATPDNGSNQSDGFTPVDDEELPF